MPRRRKGKSGSGKTRRAWKLPRFRLSLRWLAVALAAVRSRLNAQSVRRLSAGLAWVAGIGILAAAWVFGVPRLQAFASQQRFSRQVHVQFRNPPKWFKGDLAAHVAETAEMNLGGDPMRRDDLIVCRDALMQTGWFEDVRQVERLAPDLVEVDARFAHPYVVIRDADGDHLVDASGRLLPWRWPKGQSRDVAGLIAITGAHFRRPRSPGQPWEGSDIVAALKLLRVIDQQPWRSQVAAIDVTGCVRGKPMKLQTDRDIMIIWGGAPGEEPALEVLAEGKLKRLEYLYRTYQRIDAGESGVEIDLTDQRYVPKREASQPPSH